MTSSINRALRFAFVFSAAYVIGLGLADSARADGIDVPRASATAYCKTITLVCENARTYGLCPIGVTDVGELVTARLTPGATHVRLIPMGNGYRYAGRGIWFDGKGDAGRLFFGHHRSVACAVEWH